jgi:phenylpropionate dioxygenase-like ring-hydroxylating dioxygenase large terminal subunit
MMLTPTVIADEAKAVDEGYTLPSWFYTSREVYEAERRAIFATAWQLVLHENAIAEPGSYALGKVGEYEVIVTHDRAGNFHALQNVCAHRGSRVVVEPGRRATLQCPYHGWTYRLDGCLHAAAGFDTSDPRIRPGETRLKSARLAKFGPFFFVNLASHGPDLSQVTAPVSDFAVDWSTLEYAETRTCRVRCNWKTAIENSLECYHCLFAHPRLAGLVDLTDYLSLSRIHEYCVVTGGSLKQSTANKAYSAAMKSYDDGGGRYFYLWPNHWFLNSPGPPNLNIGLWYPAGVDETAHIRHYYFSPDFGSKERSEYIEYQEEITRQDVAICERVQANLAMHAFDRGLLNLSEGGSSELAVQHFDLHVLEALCQNGKTNLRTADATVPAVAREPFSG